MEKHADVVIIGAGVAGCVLALSLGRAGRKVLLLDQQARPAMNGAEFLKPSGIKVLRSFGLEEELFERGALKRTHLHYYHDGQLTVDYDCREHTSMGYYITLPYATLLRVLLLHLEDMGTVDVRWSSEMADVVMDEDRVKAVVLVDGSQIHADVFVGAEGPRSPMRQALGIDAEQWPYQFKVHPLILPITDSTEAVNRLYFSKDGGVAYFYPLSSTHQRAFIGGFEEVHPLIESFSPTELIDWMRPWVSQSDDVLGLPIDLKGKPKFPVFHFLAKRRVRGNGVLLGGSVAGVHPITGQGMNLAIEGAESLGRALNAFYDGSMSLDKALAQHEAERNPVDAKLVDYSDRLVTALRDGPSFASTFDPRLHGSARD